MTKENLREQAKIAIDNEEWELLETLVNELQMKGDSQNAM